MTNIEASLDYAKDNIIGNESFISNETIYSIDVDENKIDGDLIKSKAKKQDFDMPTIFNNISSILKDVMAGDLDAANRPEYRCLNFPQIKAAIDWLVANNGLDSTLKSLLFTESWRLNFRDKPPTPKEFITEKYIGDMAETLFPWLSEYFLDFFDPMKPYRSGVLTSCIGAGKSTISVLMNAYLSVLFALMHKPYKYYGYAPSTVFTLVYGGWSQKKASELLLEPLLNLLRSSPYFEQCRTWEDMIKANRMFDDSNGPIDKIYWTRASPTSELMFSNGLNVKIVSSAGDILGQNIIAGTLSELAFFRENGWADSKIQTFFSKLRDRIDSRMKKNYISRFILDSSPNTLESPIDDWIWNVATKDPSIKIFSGPRWKFFRDDFDINCYKEDGTIKEDWDYNFPMFKGGNGMSPHVIRSEVEYKNTDRLDVVWCPKMGAGVSMFDKAEMDPIEFLKDWAGIPSGTADRIFYQSKFIDDVFDNNLRNIYMSITAPAEEEPEHLIWNQIRDQFFNKVFDKYYFYYEPHLSRVLSVDQSISGDATCISVSHVERSKDLNENGEYNTIYVVDFTCVIIPKGGLINLDAIKFFIYDLINLGNVNIRHVSFDSFQSEAQRQWLKRHGINVDYISVDRTNEPYLNFIDYVFHGRVKCGKNIFLKNNMKSLKMSKRKSGSTKIDHMSGDIVNEGDGNWETSIVGTNAKDACDPVVANIELLNKYSDLYIPFCVWDSSKNLIDDVLLRQENLQRNLSKNGFSL
jgi:hypothetical protein